MQGKKLISGPSGHLDRSHATPDSKGSCQVGLQEEYIVCSNYRTWQNLIITGNSCTWVGYWRRLPEETTEAKLLMRYLVQLISCILCPCRLLYLTCVSNIFVNLKQLAHQQC